MNQHDQMLREAFEAIETVLEDAYHRRFAECCGRGQNECCGDFIEQWTPEDHKILDTLSPIQRQLSKALTAKPAPLVMLTGDEIRAISDRFEDCYARVLHTVSFANAIMGAMIEKNGG